MCGLLNAFNRVSQCFFCNLIKSDIIRNFLTDNQQIIALFKTYANKHKYYYLFPVIIIADKLHFQHRVMFSYCSNRIDTLNYKNCSNQ